MNGDGGSRRERGAQGAAPSGPPTGIPAENITVLCDVNQTSRPRPRNSPRRKSNDFRWSTTRRTSTPSSSAPPSIPCPQPTRR
jgi:hypothetical protein